MWRRAESEFFAKWGPVFGKVFEFADVVGDEFVLVADEPMLRAEVAVCLTIWDVGDGVHEFFKGAFGGDAILAERAEFFGAADIEDFVGEA